MCSVFKCFWQTLKSKFPLKRCKSKILSSDCQLCGDGFFSPPRLSSSKTKPNCSAWLGRAGNYKLLLPPLNRCTTICFVLESLNNGFDICN